MLLVGQLGAQPLHAAADDHQQVVEVVRDAAGQLADRFQPLRLAQCAFRRLAAIGFVVKAPGPPQRQPKPGKEERGRRQAEDQVAAHVTQPFARDRRFFYAGEYIDRESGELAITDAAIDAVELRFDREDRAVQSVRNADPELTALIEFE